MLDLGLDLTVWPWVWLAVAVVFALIELTVLGGSFVLLPFAVSAFAASLLGFYDVSVEAQWGVFLVGGGLLFAVLYRWATRFGRNHALPLGVGADRLIGAVGVITVPVDPDDVNRRGRVSIDAETWGALSGDRRPLGEGSRVRVRAVQGTRLVVEAIDDRPGEADRSTGDRPPVDDRFAVDERPIVDERNTADRPAGSERRTGTDRSIGEDPTGGSTS